MLTVTRGFTLIEALVVLAVIALLSTIAPPALSFLIEGQQLKSADTNLAAALAYARTESIKRQRPVLVMAIESDWALGWRVFADLNSNGQLEGSEPVLLEAMASPAGTVIHGNAPVRNYIRYTPNGSAKMQSGAFQAGTLSICHQSGAQPVRQLIISATGRLRRTRGPAGPC